MRQSPSTCLSKKETDRRRPGEPIKKTIKRKEWTHKVGGGGKKSLFRNIHYGGGQKRKFVVSIAGQQSAFPPEETHQRGPQKTRVSPQEEREKEKRLFGSAREKTPAKEPEGVLDQRET